jgi:hypothetical protein
MKNIFNTYVVALRSSLNPLSRLGCDQKEIPRLMENKQLISHSRQCSCTPVGFCQEFLSKEQRDNTGAFPILS